MVKNFKGTNTEDLFKSINTKYTNDVFDRYIENKSDSITTDIDKYSKVDGYVLWYED